MPRRRVCYSEREYTTTLGTRVLFDTATLPVTCIPPRTAPETPNELDLVLGEDSQRRLDTSIDRRNDQAAIVGLLK